MPKIEMSKTHQLDAQEARKRAEKVGKEMAQKYGLEITWKDDRRLEFKRTGIKGELTLKDGQACVWVDLSLLLSPLKGRVEQGLREGLDKNFA